MTKYIKVDASVEPKEEGFYHCIFPEGQIFTIPFSKDFGFHEEFTDCSGITHYLLEVPDNESALIKRNEQLESILKNTLQLNKEVLQQMKYVGVESEIVELDLPGNISQITELLNKVKPKAI